MLLLLSAFALLASSTYIGRFFYSKRLRGSVLVGDESKVIITIALSFLGLLLLLALSKSITGYNARQQSQLMEAISIANAYQRSDLLTTNNKDKAKVVLDEYLDGRMSFFKSGVKKNEKKWSELTLGRQAQLWHIATEEAMLAPNAVIESVLSAYSDLHASQQKTIASWRYQIPITVWVFLIFISISINILFGYSAKEGVNNKMLILLLPFLTAISLFIIAEIDIPGEGIIHVIPIDLEALKSIVSKK